MVEIIPKKAAQVPNWLNILFYTSLILLIFSIANYFVLDYFSKKSQETLEYLEKTLRETETPEAAALKKEILDYQRKIEKFSYLTEQHLKASEVFSILQETCHPKVWFSQFSLDPRKGLVTLSGETESFETLGQQNLIFREERLIRNVNLETISISGTGKINFSFSLSFDPKAFIFK